MKHACHVVKGLAVDYFASGGVDDCDLRIGLAAERARIRIDVRAVDPFAIWRKGKIAGAASGKQALDFYSAREVDDRNVAAEPVCDVQGRPRFIENHSGWLKSGRQSLHDFARGRVDN